MYSSRLWSATPALALLAAGLIATTTPASVAPPAFTGPDLRLTSSAVDLAGAAPILELPDPFGAMQAVLTLGGDQIGEGFSYLFGGDLGDGVGLLATGLTNSVVYAPVASLLTVVDAVVGQSPDWLRLPDDYFLGFSDANGLFDNLQSLFDVAFDRFGDAIPELLTGQINHGVSDIAYGLTNFIPDMPVQVVIGAAVLFEDLITP